MLPHWKKAATSSSLAPGLSAAGLALYLLRSGFRVTLIDAWGAGNSRSGSGDETRVIRSTYGANELYFNLNIRALELWKAHQKKWDKPLFHPSGVLWFCYEEKVDLIDASLPFMEKHGLAYQYFSRKEAQIRFPQVFVDDLDHLVLDPNGGYLRAIRRWPSRVRCGPGAWSISN
ncbi:MAG: FAD-dependent oxidoreductase [Haliscomenobacter sp.]|nr:FAD-dependent oxidoreductase [Haliscomenobacter sp.]